MTSDDPSPYLDPSVGSCGVLDVSGPAAREAMRKLMRYLVEPTDSEIIATIIVIPKGWKREMRYARWAIIDYLRSDPEQLRMYSRRYYSKNAQILNAKRVARRRAKRSLTHQR